MYEEAAKARKTTQRNFERPLLSSVSDETLHDEVRVTSQAFSAVNGFICFSGVVAICAFGLLCTATRNKKEKDYREIHKNKETRRTRDDEEEEEKERNRSIVDLPPCPSMSPCIIHHGSFLGFFSHP